LETIVKAICPEVRKWLIRRILAASQNVLLKLSTEDEAAGNRLKLEQVIYLIDMKAVTSNTETRELTITFG
jgi:hypothetical protein